MKPQRVIIYLVVVIVWLVPAALVILPDLQSRPVLEGVGLAVGLILAVLAVLPLAIYLAERLLHRVSAVQRPDGDSEGGTKSEH